MLTRDDVDAWIEIQDGLARAAEREFEVRVMREFYERRREDLMRRPGSRS